MSTFTMFTCVPCGGTGTVATRIRRWDGTRYLRGGLCPVCDGLGQTRAPWHPSDLVPLAVALRTRKGEVKE